MVAPLGKRTGAKFNVKTSFKSYSFEFTDKNELLEIEAKRLNGIGLLVNGIIYEYDSCRITVPRKEIRRNGRFLRYDNWIPVIDTNTEMVISQIVFPHNRKGTNFMKTSKETVWVTEKYLWKEDELIKTRISPYFELYPNKLFLLSKRE